MTRRPSAQTCHLRASHPLPKSRSRSSVRPFSAPLHTNWADVSDSYSGDGDGGVGVCGRVIGQHPGEGVLGRWCTPSTSGFAARISAIHRRVCKYPEGRTWTCHAPRCSGSPNPVTPPTQAMRISTLWTAPGTKTGMSTGRSAVVGRTLREECGSRTTPESCKSRPPMHDQFHRDQLPPLPSRRTRAFTIRCCDQCHTMPAADAPICSSCRSTEPGKIPSSGTTRSCRGRSSSCRPVGRAPTSPPVTGTIVADDDRTVGHTPGSTTPSRRVPGARSASAMTG